MAARTLRLAAPLMRGADVKAAQRLLIDRGFLPAGSDDGVVGNDTIEGAIEAKTVLGYPDRLVIPVIGSRLLGYLDGKPVPGEYAERAEKRAKARPAGALQLPAFFNATHPTAGLPGYPAVDVFADGGTVVLSPVFGLVSKLSGSPPRDLTHLPPEDRHGALGWSVYIDSRFGVYYLTHFGTRGVKLRQGVDRGEPLGTVADFAKLSGGEVASHIHEGKHAA